MVAMVPGVRGGPPGTAFGAQGPLGRRLLTCFTLGSGCVQLSARIHEVTDGEQPAAPVTGVENSILQGGGGGDHGAGTKLSPVAMPDPHRAPSPPTQHPAGGHRAPPPSCRTTAGMAPQTGGAGIPAGGRAAFTPQFAPDGGVHTWPHPHRGRGRSPLLCQGARHWLGRGMGWQEVGAAGGCVHGGGSCTGRGWEHAGRMHAGVTASISIHRLGGNGCPLRGGPECGQGWGLAGRQLEPRWENNSFPIPGSGGCAGSCQGAGLDMALPPRGLGDGPGYHPHGPRHGHGSSDPGLSVTLRVQQPALRSVSVHAAVARCWPTPTPRCHPLALAVPSPTGPVPPGTALPHHGVCWGGGELGLTSGTPNLGQLPPPRAPQSWDG